MKPNDTFPLAGTQATLRCATDTPSNIIKWYNHEACGQTWDNICSGHTIYESNALFTNTSFRGFNVSTTFRGVHNLVISNVGLGDGSVYVCQEIEGPTASQRAVATLSVVGKFFSPMYSAIRSLENRTTADGHFILYQ